MKKNVLGLFADEDELRDHLARNLTIIEPGLQLIKTNYVVSNPLGAGGAFDILAKDRFRNFVIIEVKRSDQAARHALHELSKYIALFMEDQKVNSHKIRCFVVSTSWHELDVPLSFFKDACPVDVSGFEVTSAGTTVTVKKRLLPRVSLESRLSPDMRFSFFDSAKTQKGYCNDLQDALSNVQHVRAALIVMEPVADRERMCLLCAWRVPDIALVDVKTLVFDPDFQEEYYYFPGWELETDLCDWLENQSDKAGAVWAEDSRATPEKVDNYKSHYRYTKLIKLGDWPANDLVNDLDHVLQCVVAKDISAKRSRANRHHFEAVSSRSTGKAWNYTSDAFEEFITGNELWTTNYKRIERDLPDDAVVTFGGYHMRHFYYAVHQGVEYPGAALSTFGLDIKCEDGYHKTVVGGWLWDGTTRPVNARANIERAYGNVGTLSMLVHSATDQEQYDSIYWEHGFFPYVAVYDIPSRSYELFVSEDAPIDIDIRRGLKAFVEANPDYCNEVSACLATVPRNAAKFQ